MKYAVITFGCRVNQADSLAIEEELVSAGARPGLPSEADLVVVNTCSVTASADQGARQTIRRVARQNPHARIVVTGCYATRRPDELAELPNVVSVVPNPEKARVIPLIRQALAPVLSGSFEGVSTAERFGDGDGACGMALEPGVAGRTAFTLRVQTGCDETCAYCIIPTTRGRPISVSPDRIVREVDRVVRSGFREIAITGVHLGSYGRDLSPALSLGELLQRLAHDTASTTRYRVSSLEPMDCTPEIVSLIASDRTFARHFHLPLQHASGRVLAAMHRPYTLDDYDALVRDIRRQMPDAAIGSDIIVGFPGETNHDFEILERYLAESPLTHLHVFPYSDRPGTAASVMRDKVAGTVVRERAQKIRQISDRLASRFRHAQVGTTQSALTIDDGSLVVTSNYLKLRVEPGLSRNEWVTVRVMSHEHGELLAG